MTIDRPIAIALTLFIALSLVFFLVVPEYKTFGKLQIELGEKKAEFNEKFDYYATIVKAYYELQNRPDDIEKINDALPPSPDLGELIYFLQQVAAENGLAVKDLSFSTSSFQSGKISNPGIKDIAFSMSVLATYRSLENFIISLEKSSRIFEVASISFGYSSGTPPQSSQSQSRTQTQSQPQQVYNFSLQIKTHSY